MKLKEVYDKGYRRVCMNCNTVWKPDTVRTEPYETGHGYVEQLEICRCGCDLIGYIIKGKLGGVSIERTEKQ